SSKGSQSPVLAARHRPISETQVSAYLPGSVGRQPASVSAWATRTLYQGALTLTLAPEAGITMLSTLLLGQPSPLRRGRRPSLIFPLPLNRVRPFGCSSCGRNRSRPLVATCACRSPA